jgi:hypothetical protein
MVNQHVFSLSSRQGRTALGTALVLLTLSGSCKLVDEGSQALVTSSGIPLMPLPPQLVGTYWGGHDQNCSYVQGFPSSSQWEVLMTCTRVLEDGTTESRTTRNVRLIGLLSSESKGSKVGPWTLRALAGSAGSSCDHLKAEWVQESQFSVELHSEAKVLNTYVRKPIGAVEYGKIENSQDLEALRNRAKEPGQGCQDAGTIASQ